MIRRLALIATLAAAPAFGMASVEPRLALRHTPYAPVLTKAHDPRPPVLLARLERIPRPAVRHLATLRPALHRPAFARLAAKLKR